MGFCMDTEAALQSINDGVLESLAAHCIEWQRPELRGLIQTGINADGKSVPDPVDGIRIVSLNRNGRRELVLVAATATEQSELSRKWFGETPLTKDGKARRGRPKIGDIEKAHSRWQKEKADEELGAVLWLATNRRIDSELVQKVSRRGSNWDSVQSKSLKRRL